MPESVPSNHSPFFAPLMEPTLSTGVRTLVVAAGVAELTRSAAVEALAAVVRRV